MDSARSSAIEPDLKKLLAIVAVFNWTALLVLARKAPLDYVAFFTAGHLIASGQGRSLFDLATQAHFQTVVLGKSGTLPYYHLAYEALAFVPLSLLPFTLSLWIWRLVICGAILGACLISTRLFQLQLSDLLLLMMGFLSTATAFAQGQDSLIVVLFIAICFWFVLKDQDVFAGASLAFALFKPQLILPIAAVLIWKRRARFAGGFLVGAALVLALSTSLTGLQGWAQWRQLVMLAGSHGGAEIGASATWMANIHGLIQAFIHREELVPMLALLASLALAVMTLHSLKKMVDPRAYLPPAIVMALLVSYHSNIHDLAVLLIPIWALIDSGDGSIATRTCLGLCFSFPFFLAGGLVPYFSIVVLILWFIVLRTDFAKIDKVSDQELI